MKLEILQLLSKYNRASDTATDWLIASWEYGIDPFERKIRKLRYAQHKKECKKLAKELYLSTK